MSPFVADPRKDNHAPLWGPPGCQRLRARSAHGLLSPTRARGVKPVQPGNGFSPRADFRRTPVDLLHGPTPESPAHYTLVIGGRFAYLHLSLLSRSARLGA